MVICTPYLMGVCTSCTQTHSEAGSIFSDPAGHVQCIMWALAGMAGGINSCLVSPVLLPNLTNSLLWRELEFGGWRSHPSLREGLTTKVGVLA
jgi:hypothetical protein